ncbi:MAG: ATP-binding cassette domain-containing protein [Acidimicrobiia bacterium]|nr:ATP-binding cassette domain-containing protein [Acidimicrobiia bacterium]
MTTSDEPLKNDRRILSRGPALIARQLRRAARPFAEGGVGTVVYAAATIVSSFVVGWATDNVLIEAVESGSTSRATLGVMVVLIVGVAALKGGGVTLRRLGAYKAQYLLQARDRIEVTDRYLELPLVWHRRHPTGQLISNVSSDVEAASMVAAPLPMAFGVVVMLLITAILLVLTDVFLAIIGFLMIPALAVANYVYQRKMRTVAATAQRVRSEVAEIAHESFDAALVVKTLGREDDEVGRFGEQSDRLRDRMVEVGRLRAMFDPVIEALPNLSILAVLFVGAARVEDGLLTAGSLVTFAYLFRLVAFPMRVFGWLLGQLPRSVVGLDRIEAVLGADTSFGYGDRSADGMGGASANVEAIHYRHPAESRFDLMDGESEVESGRGISGIDLDLEPGRTVAIVGPTGSGKSTIAHLLVRLFDPDMGEITLDGRLLTDVERESLARAAVLVFQEPFLFDDTVRANITLGDDFSDDEILAAAKIAQADGFISELAEGYDSPVGERGSSLSGGQRQRIALARALVRRPRLLVLDDATSAVDPAVEAAILDGLRQLETTVVIVAYRRSSIVLADEVIFVEDGRVSGRGSHKVLYDRLGAYRELIDAYEQEAEE